MVIILIKLNAGKHRGNKTAGVNILCSSFKNKLTIINLASEFGTSTVKTNEKRYRIKFLRK